MTSLTASKPAITAADVDHYNQHGYCLLERVIPDDMLELLRSGAQRSMDSVDAEMDRLDTDIIGINLRGKRYFSANPGYRDPRLYSFVFSDLMRTIAQALIGDDVWAFWEQYVIKGAESGASFSWHQDSSYVGKEHPRYLTCWCALDDMSEANGTARLLPFGRGPSELVEHTQDPDTNDLIGYTGDDPGDPVICPAGSIACFTSHTMHSSGANPSPALRRVYLIQYGLVPIDKGGARNEPLLLGGKPVLGYAG